MAAFTLETARERLQLALDAEAEALSAQGVTNGDQSLYRAKLEHIQESILYWRNEVDRLEKQAAGQSTFQRLHTRFL